MLCSERIMGDLLGRFQLGRASYELKSEEAEAIRAKFTTAPGPPGSASLTCPTPLLTSAKSASEYTAWKAHHPSILEEFQNFAESLRGKRLAVFLDYDGTLTPIVKDPDRAFMSDQMRSAVKTLAGLFPTSIISGRGREKVEGFVQLKELYYAGSHGMDIVGPKANTKPGDADVLAFQPAAKYAPIMDAVYQALLRRVQNVPGASVEHNKFCVSVHFRNCPPQSYDDVVTAVKDTLHDHPNLKASRGRKVLEIQPQVDWGKGKALAHMLNALNLDECDDVIPIYLGDDRTDEDAFKVLKDWSTGFGILISNKMKETDAKYTLTDPSEVMAFLTRLVQWGATPDNAWHQHLCCTGWCLKPSPQPPLDPTTDPSAASSIPAGYASTDRQTATHSEANGAHLHDIDRIATGHDATSAAAASPGHSPSSGSAFAAVRQFHGLPVVAGTSDRAMPASQWATQSNAPGTSRHDGSETNRISPSRHSGSQMGTHHANVSATDLVDLTHQQQQQPSLQQPTKTHRLQQDAPTDSDDAERQAAASGQQDAEDQMLSQHSFSLLREKAAAKEGVDTIEAEGRPPTAINTDLAKDDVSAGTADTADEEEEDMAPPARSSLDHYLRQPLKASNTADDSGMTTDESQASHMGEWDTPTVQLDASSGARSPSKSPGSPNRGSFATKPFASKQAYEGGNRMLPDGKRLTALLLDKLQGHEGHLPLRQDGGSGPISPTGHSHSHDSGSSMAGYQSPFESLAYEVRSEGTDSVKAEDGSVKSFSMAQAD